jgi:AdoMet-dependent heme synthase
MIHFFLTHTVKNMVFQMSNSGLHIVEIEITNRCNLNCTHCYVKKDTITDLPYEKVIELIDKCAELNVTRIVLTGGEALLHKNCIEFANYAKDKGIPEVILFSNGLLINEKNVNDLKVFNFVQISIDVPPKRENSLRIQYSDRIEKAINTLKTNNIDVTLLATLHKSLVPYIDELVSYAKEKEARIAFNKLVPIGKDPELKKECLDKDELRITLKKIGDYTDEGVNIGCSDPLLFLAHKKRMEHFQNIKRPGITGGCTAGIAALYVDCKGDVLPCPFIHLSDRNVFDNSLDKIWFESPLFNKIRNRRNYDLCGSCQFVLCCGGCRAASYYNNDKIDGADPNCLLKK